MLPIRDKERKSEQAAMSNEEQRAVDIMSQKIPTKEPSRGPQESPLKRRKAGITLAQKQALIDNLQLESMFAP